MNDITPQMQFGIFTVSDITEDPTTGRTPSEAEKIRNTITVAKHAEEVGLLEPVDNPGGIFDLDPLNAILKAAGEPEVAGPSVQ